MADIASLITKLETIRTELKKLRSKGGYTENEVLALQEQLAEVEALRNGGAFHDANGGIPKGQARLHQLLHYCYRTAHLLLEHSYVDPEYLPVLHELEDIRHGLEELKEADSATEKDLNPFQDRLRVLDATRVNNSFPTPSGKVKNGQGVLHDLLATCYTLVDELHAHRPHVDPPLCPIRRELSEILSKLTAYKKKGGFTHADLDEVRKRLVYIDSQRKNAAFVDDNGHVPHGQAELHSLLHKNFRLLRILSEGSEVAPALEPVLTQLEEIHDKLKELKARKDKNEVKVTEVMLTEFQDKLQKIEEQRKDAAVKTKGGAIPPGQAVVHDLLHSCYTLLAVVRKGAE